MDIDLMVLAQQTPLTGDHAPIKICLIILGIAAVVLAVTTVISKKKK